MIQQQNLIQDSKFKWKILVAFAFSIYEGLTGSGESILTAKLNKMSRLYKLSFFVPKRKRRYS